jgi:cardiolipin synthase
VNILVWGPLALYVVELVIKVVAIGTIPGNRRPSSSLAWLLLIVLVPILGLLIFLLIGSPFVRGRRAKIQAAANQIVLERTGHMPELPLGVALPAGLPSLVRLNRELTSFPCTLGVSHGLLGNYAESIREMTEAVDAANERVHVEFFIISWDDSTDGLFQALVRAVERGVKVRLLYDHIATRRYPRYKETNSRLTAAGVEWYPMMPIKPLKGRWRRPDLRNHRKLLVVDGTTGFMGSQNIIAASYLLPANIKVGREWQDLNIKLAGPIVGSLEMVFATDWYTETGQRLGVDLGRADNRPSEAEPMQLVPSGPGYLTIPNLRLFTALVHRAQHKLSLTSPYFVPDDSLLEAITTAS